MRIPRLLATLVVAIAGTTSLSAQALPRGIQQIASVEGVTEYRLENGLRAVLFPDPARPTTTVNIVYLVGSRHEDYGETGMAHLLEHLMSFGSPKHPDAKAEQAARGAQRNASTSVDRTNYFETFPASDENLEWALDLEADRMRGAWIKKDILDSQMSVVRNEMERGENSPEQILFQRVRSTAFLWHNYGKSTIGARSDVENVPIERLQAFYDRYYHPDNAVLIVAGKFETPRALELIAAKFGAIPRAPKPIPPTYTAEPTQDGERLVTLRRVGDTQAVFAGYHVVAASHPDNGALRILADVLAGEPNGRLFKALVDTKKAVSVSAGSGGLRETGFSLVTASLRKEHSLDEVRDILLRTLDELATNPPAAEEVDRSRAKLLRQIELAQANSSALASALVEAIANGDWRLVFLQRDWVRNAKVEDVARVAKTYFVPSNRTLGIFTPETAPARAEIPPPPAIESLVRDYKGDATIAAGEVFDPTPENIDARTIRGALPGGVKFALLPKQTRGGVVRAELTLRFGDQESLRGTRATAAAARLLLMRGTTQRTRQQIADELTRLKSRMFASGGVGSVSLNIETVRANLPELLKLASEVLREPAFAPAEFDRAQQEMLASLEEQRSDPQSLATLHLQRHLNPYAAGDVRAVLLPDEAIAEVKAVTADSVRAFWGRFAGASDGEFVVVGDFDAPAIQKLAGELFGNWKSPLPYRRITRDYAKISPVNRFIETPDKANALFRAGLLLPVTDEHADYPALALANYMLGGHSASRLYLRIRGKEGLSYSAGSTLAVNSGEAAAEWGAFAIANPPNIPKVEVAFQDELQRALREGFDADEIVKAKNGYLQSRRVGRSQDAALIGLLQTQARFGRTSQFTADFEKKVAALTAEQIAETLRRYLSPEQISIFKAGDFKKAGGSE